MRKVLVVSPYRSEYGPGHVLDHVVQALAAGGYEPVCAVPDVARVPKDVLSAGIRIHGIGELSTFPRTVNAVRLGRFMREHGQAAARIEEIAKQEDAALIYSTSEAIICGSLAARKLGRPAIIHAIGMSIASPRAVAGVYIRLLDRITDQFVACSAAVAEMFESHGVSDDKTTVVHNGISVNLVDTASVRELPGTGGKIGMIAAYDPRKGHELFIDAAAQVIAAHPNATFFLIGGVLPGQRDSAAFEQVIQKRIADRGLDVNVVRTGFIPAPEIYETIKALDIVVVPSATEAFAHALLEAMACAKPVIATRIEGNLDALVHEASGVYVRPNPGEMANAICTLLDDPERAKAMGEAARSRVQTLFDLRMTLPPIAHTVDALLARQSVRDAPLPA